MQKEGVSRHKSHETKFSVIRDITSLVDSPILKIPEWLSNLHEVPIHDAINLSEIQKHDGNGVALLKNLTRMQNNEHVLEKSEMTTIQIALGKITNTIKGPHGKFERKPNNLTLGDLRRLEDGVLNRFGLDPLEVVMLRKLFGYSSRDGSPPQVWVEHLKKSKVIQENDNLEFAQLLSGFKRAKLTRELDSSVPPAFRGNAKTAVFETINLISCPKVENQFLGVNLKIESLPALIGHGYLEKIDGLDEATRKTILLRLFC